MDSYVVTPNGSLQKYNPSTGKTNVISNDMPSDINDPYRMNLIDVRERNPISIRSALEMQKKINNGILNNKIK